MDRQKIFSEHKKYYEGLLEKLSTKEGFLLAGIPRFRELFGRDTLISSLELMGRSPQIARDSLAILAKKQGKKINAVTGEEPGKILHELYSEKWGHRRDAISVRQKFPKENVGYFFSIDSTPLFIITAAEFYKRTRDSGFIEGIIPNIVSAMNWITEYGIKDGLLVYNRSTYGKQLASMFWKDGCWGVYDKLKGDIAAIEVQSYAYRAIDSFIYLAGELGIKHDNSRLRTIQRRLKTETEKKFWMKKEKTYSPAISLDGEMIKSVTSGPGHLLYSDILDKEKADAVVKRLFHRDMLTRYGIRTTAKGDDYFDARDYQKGAVWFNDNWQILSGLDRLGYEKEYTELKGRLLNYIVEKKLPLEYIGVSKRGSFVDIKKLKVKPCAVQAWTVGAFIDILDRELS